MLGSKLDIFKLQWLDVVFADRNKSYGAYELRRENSRTTSKALLIGGILFILAVSSPMIAKYISGFIPDDKEKLIVTDVVLAPPPPVDESTPPPPPPPEPPRPKVSTIKFPPLVVVPKEEAVEDPPTVEEIKVADPGQKTIEGDPTADVVIDAPVGEAPKSAAVTEDDGNRIFESVEVLPKFPGGDAAWSKFIQKNYNYPPAAQEQGVAGRVFLSFVVEKDGSLTDVKIVRDLGMGTGEEAKRVLMKSPKWSPGIQNGRPVRVAYTMPFVLQFEAQ